MTSGCCSCSCSRSSPPAAGCSPPRSTAGRSRPNSAGASASPSSASSRSSQSAPSSAPPPRPVGSPARSRMCGARSRAPTAASATAPAVSFSSATAARGTGARASRSASTHLLAGVGAAGFGVARTRYTTDSADRRARPQLPGRDVRRLRPHRPGASTSRCSSPGPWPRGARCVARRPACHLAVAAERAGALTLLSVVVVFGVHSAVDWTWFIPGHRGSRAALRGLARRARAARGAGRARERPALAAHPPAGRGRPRRAARPRRDRAGGSSGSRCGRPMPMPRRSPRSRTATPPPRSTTPTPRPPAIRCRPSRCGSCRRSTARSASRAAARAELRKAIDLQPDNPATWRRARLLRAGARPQPRRARRSQPVAQTRPHIRGHDDCVHPGRGAIPASPPRAETGPGEPLRPSAQRRAKRLRRPLSDARGRAAAGAGAAARRRPRP